MSLQYPRPRHAATAILACLTLGVYGCGDSAGSDPSPLAPSFAKPGTENLTVTSADPSEALQDTTLNVTVSGTGFDDGSAVTMLRGGVATNKVVTNSTIYVTSRKLIANITIAADADVGLYDVQVFTSGGKRGVGTEQFSVKPRGNTDTDSRATFAFFATAADGSAANLRGDGRDADGMGTGLDPSTYQGDRCGVHAKIFAVNPEGSASGDAVVQPAGDAQHGTCGAARELSAHLGGGVVEPVRSLNIKCVMQLVPGSAVGACPYPDMHIDPLDPTVGYYPLGADATGCARLRWNPEVLGGAAGTGPFPGNVRVTYLGTTGPGGARQWRAETLPPHAAGCYVWKKGTYTWDRRTRIVPFRVVITEVPFAAP